jgi:hypothetical protein
LWTKLFAERKNLSTISILTIWEGYQQDHPRSRDTLIHECLEKIFPVSVGLTRESRVWICLNIIYFNKVKVRPSIQQFFQGETVYPFWNREAI